MCRIQSAQCASSLPGVCATEAHAATRSSQLASAVRRRRPLPECVEAGLCTPALQWVLRFLRSLLLHHFSSRGAGNYVGHYHKTTSCGRNWLRLIRPHRCGCGSVICGDSGCCMCVPTLKMGHLAFFAKNGSKSAGFCAKKVRVLQDMRTNLCIS